MNLGTILEGFVERLEHHTPAAVTPLNPSHPVLESLRPAVAEIEPPADADLSIPPVPPVSPALEPVVETAIPMAQSQPKENTVSELSDLLKNTVAALKADAQKLAPDAQAIISTGLTDLDNAVAPAVQALDTAAAGAATTVPTVGPFLAAAITEAEPTFLEGAKSLVAFLQPIITGLEAKAAAEIASV